MTKWDDYWEHGHTRIGGWMLNNARKKAIGMINEYTIKNALDIGCGSGETYKMLETKCNSVFGIDNSIVSINKCKNTGLNVIESSVEYIPYSNNSFSLVFSEGILEHFKDFRRAASEMARVSNHLILLIQPNHSSIYHKMQSLYFLFTKNHIREYPYEIGDFDKVFGQSDFFRIKTETANMFWIMLYHKFPQVLEVGR